MAHVLAGCHRTARPPPPSPPPFLLLSRCCRYKYSMLPACVGVLLGFCALFALSATYCFKKLNFQRR